MLQLNKKLGLILIWRPNVGLAIVQHIVRQPILASFFSCIGCHMATQDVRACKIGHELAQCWLAKFRRKLAIRCLYQTRVATPVTQVRLRIAHLIYSSESMSELCPRPAPTRAKPALKHPNQRLKGQENKTSTYVSKVVLNGGYRWAVLQITLTNSPLL